MSWTRSLEKGQSVDAEVAGAGPEAEPEDECMITMHIGSRRDSRRDLRSDLYSFVQRFFPSWRVAAFLPNWHVEAITYALTRVLLARSSV